MWECELYTFTRQSDPFCLLLSINSEYLQKEESDKCRTQTEYKATLKHPKSCSESDLNHFLLLQCRTQTLPSDQW